MKNLITVSVAIMQLVLITSCSSNSFSKRKYRKGVFKEYSVRTKRDKQQPKKIFYSHENENKDLANEQTPNLIQEGQTYITDSLQSGAETTQNKIKVDTTRKEHDSKLKKIPKDEKLDHTSKEKKKKELSDDALSKTSKITGWTSLILLTIISALLIFFIFFTLQLLAIIILVILVLAIFITNLVLTLRSSKRIGEKGESNYEKQKNLRKSRILTIIALCLSSLILAAILIWLLVKFIIILIDIFSLLLW